MKRKTFIMTLMAPIIGLFAKVSSGITNVNNQRTVQICNDDGTLRDAEFEDLIYADYFYLVEPNGALVDELFLATSDLFFRNDGFGESRCLAIGVYEERDSINSNLTQIVTTRPYFEYRLYELKDKI